MLLVSATFNNKLQSIKIKCNNSSISTIVKLYSWQKLSSVKYRLWKLNDNLMGMWGKNINNRIWILIEEPNYPLFRKKNWIIFDNVMPLSYCVNLIIYFQLFKRLNLIYYVVVDHNYLWLYLTSNITLSEYIYLFICLYKVYSLCSFHLAKNFFYCIVDSLTYFHWIWSSCARSMYSYTLELVYYSLYNCLIKNFCLN